MLITARQAYDLRTIQPGAMLPAPWHAMCTADLKARAEQDEAAAARKAASTPDVDTPPGSPPDPIDRALRHGPPRRPTTARLKTYFLRVFERCGSVAEAAARAGVTPRTAQRWAAGDPLFAARLADLKSRRVELLEDLALQRASGRTLAPHFYHGRQVATVERLNDRMLMRVLDRFDRAREREVRAAAAAQAARDMEAEIDRRMSEHHRQIEEADRQFRKLVEERFEERVAREVEKRISQMSPSTRL